jgi:hypothetical protein
VTPDFLGPGMSGPEVSRVQRLVGVEMTGTYDEETTQIVRGLQVLHKTTLQDGCFDAELEHALTRKK